MSPEQLRQLIDYYEVQLRALRASHASRCRELASSCGDPEYRPRGGLGGVSISGWVEVVARVDEVERFLGELRSYLPADD